MGTYAEKFSHPGYVDPNLLAWLKAAAAQSPYNVVAYSGNRPGDPRYHGKGMAVDVNLIDPKTGATVPNYQNAGSFKTYQDFANLVRAAQMQANPNAALRWGGYFSGPKGKYGAMDLMHFDVGNTPMGGGGWDTGLTQEQAALWNLQPGGGSTAVAGANLPQVLPDILANATMPQTGKDYGLSGMASKALGRLGQGGGDTGGIVDASGGFDPGSLVSPETRPADLIPQANPGAFQVGPLADLADLFQVKPIGQAGQAALPGRRF